MLTKTKGAASWTTTHSWFVVMGGFAVKDPEGIAHALKSMDFLVLLRARVIEFPRISVIEIEEKSKGSGFIKAIAAVQILYLAAELLGRAIQRLAVSTLELFTLAMVMMALFLYALWWNKPQDVRLPFMVKFKNGSDGAPALLDRGVQLRKRVGLLAFNFSHTRENVLITVLAVTIFGACHLIGWNFDSLLV
ncbi:hypothetical protein E6O75_ATG04923 [Venturia nashicola]|uniref:Uncharacterized protein n=1 Tax=Venturia nashicola TaxID=86259 RepID=A0A4Z1NZ32_9PEZI|nr:hypothetical protein E6O75_ATG04923 [Venturia nashicola]